MHLHKNIHTYIRTECKWWLALWGEGGKHMVKHQHTKLDAGYLSFRFYASTVGMRLFPHAHILPFSLKIFVFFRCTNFCRCNWHVSITPTYSLCTSTTRRITILKHFISIETRFFSKVDCAKSIFKRDETLGATTYSSQFDIKNTL